MARTEDRDTARSLEEWRARYEAAPERGGELTSSISGAENEHTPENVDVDYERDLGYPGDYPFTRGVYPSMYRAACGRCASSRASDLRRDQRAVPLPARSRADGALDRVRHADADGLRLRPRALARRGRPRRGRLADMETLFAGIPLAEVSTSMTINSRPRSCSRSTSASASSRVSRATGSAGRSRRTSSRSTSRRRSTSSRPSRRCGSSPT